MLTFPYLCCQYCKTEDPLKLVSCVVMKAIEIYGLHDFSRGAGLSLSGYP